VARSTGDVLRPTAGRRHGNPSPRRVAIRTRRCDKRATLSAAREIVKALDLLEVGQEISRKIEDASFGCERYLLALPVAVGNRKREDESPPMASLAVDVAENDHLIAAQLFQGQSKLVVPTAWEDGTTRSLCRSYGELPLTLCAIRISARGPERCNCRGNRQDTDCADDKGCREPSHSRRVVRRYGGGKSNEGGDGLLHAPCRPSASPAMRVSEAGLEGSFL
jgi:hypothetical protein